MTKENSPSVAREPHPLALKARAQVVIQLLVLPAGEPTLGPLSSS
jgi:hypothetical protein